MAAQSQGSAKAQSFLTGAFRDVVYFFLRVPSGDPEAIHQARVKARRWAAACRLLAGVLGNRRANRMAKSVRKFAKALSKIRALDVCLELVQGLPGSFASKQGLIKMLKDKKQKAWNRARKTFTRPRLEKLFEKLTRDMQKMRVGIPGWANSQTSLRKLESAWQDRAQRVLKTGSKKQWHRLRIATKHQRYVLEGARTLGIGGSSGQIKKLRALQGHLGDAHDVEVLAKRIRKTFISGPDRRKSQVRIWKRTLSEKIQRSLARGRPIARELLSLKTGAP